MKSNAQRAKIVGMVDIGMIRMFLFIKLLNKNIDASVCSVLNISYLRKNSIIYQALIQVELLYMYKILVGYDYCTVYGWHWSITVL